MTQQVRPVMPPDRPPFSQTQESKLSERLLLLPAFQDFTQPPCTMPISPLGKRIRYVIKEYDPLLDSCNMTHRDWSRIALDIKSNYAAFDAFVILHGTDTMAFTSSILSFMLVNLGKTVIVTGSQIPLSMQRNDGESNLLGALTIAGHYVIPEVCLYFDNKLLRGNRSTKMDASALAAFSSENFPPLASVGVDYAIAWEKVLPMPPLSAEFDVDARFEPNVGVLTLFPGMSGEMARNMLRPPMKGMVLRAFGAGNAPDRDEHLLGALRDASAAGVVIVCVTQCPKGAAAAHYATGVALMDAGVVSCADMTVEAALTKLGHLLGQGLSARECREAMMVATRGEMTIPSLVTRFSMNDRSFIQNVYRALTQGAADEDAERHLSLIRQALSPVLLCSAAGTGDLEQLKNMVEAGSDVNAGDYDGRTAMHLAASEGRLDCVKYLVKVGAHVSPFDRWGGTPLLDSLRVGHTAVSEALRAAGAVATHEELTRLLHGAARDGKLKVLQSLFAFNPGSVKMIDREGRTALHIACLHAQEECIAFLLSCGCELSSPPDVWGVTPAHMGDREKERREGRERTKRPARVAVAAEAFRSGLAPKRSPTLAPTVAPPVADATQTIPSIALTAAHTSITSPTGVNFNHVEADTAATASPSAHNVGAHAVLALSPITRGPPPFLPHRLSPPTRAVPDPKPSPRHRRPVASTVTSSEFPLSPPVASRLDGVITGARRETAGGVYARVPVHAAAAGDHHRDPIPRPRVAAVRHPSP